MACAACLSALAACAPPPPSTPVGISDAVPELPPKPQAVSRPLWADFAQARGWPEAGRAFIAKTHHRDGGFLHVRVEPAFLSAYRELSVDGAMPDGARIVAWEETPQGAPLGGYLLTKRGAAWTADEIDREGALVAGDHAACVRCHDMAPTDHLFGMPITVETAAPGHPQ